MKRVATTALVLKRLLGSADKASAAAGAKAIEQSDLPSRSGGMNRIDVDGASRESRSIQPKMRRQNAVLARLQLERSDCKSKEDTR